MDDLSKVLADIRAKIEKYTNASQINEQNTKSSLIQPLLRSLGWDVEDLEEVSLEYRGNSSDPVDYALLMNRNPILFVEAKALGKSLEDPKWEKQILGYALVAGVRWVVLTNGDEYRIFNSHAEVPVKEKLFRRVCISESVEQAAAVLDLLRKENMAGQRINHAWKAQFVDAQVLAVLKKLFPAFGEPAADIVQLIHKQLSNLKSDEISESVQRIQVIFTPPKLVIGPPKEPIPNPGPETEPTGDSSLSLLLKCGAIEPNQKIFRTYRGTLITAKVLSCGSVLFAGTKYGSLSSAAVAAKLQVSGEPHSANGWAFWSTKGSDGQQVRLIQLRKQHLPEAN